MVEGEEEFLGDGLYASFQGDSFKLRAPRGHLGDHEVWLEPSVLKNFLQYITHITKKLEEQQARYQNVEH